MSSGKSSLYFFLIVIINIIIKSIFLNATPYSFDEIISVKDTLLDFGHIKHESEWDNNPPFYYYCLWVWHQILPISEFNSRFLSVIFVSLGIGFAYKFSNKYFGFSTAIFTVLFLSLSNFLTFYAQETRAYSLVFFLSLVSTNFLFQYLEKPDMKRLLLIAFINFLLIYTHYITSLLVIFQFLFVLIFYKKLFKKYFFVSSLVIIILIFLRFTKKQFLNILSYNKKDDFWLQKAEPQDLINAVSQLFLNKTIVLVFLSCILIFLIHWRNCKDDKNFKLMIYLFSVGYLSIFILYIVGTFKAIFLSRYLIFCIPFATIFCFKTLLLINKVGFFGCVALIFIALINLNIYKESGMDYKSVARLVSNLKSYNDIVVINKRDNILLFEYYFDRNNFLKYKNIDSLANTQNVYAMNEVQQLNSLPIKKNVTLFLFQSFHNLHSSKNEFSNFLENGNTKIYHTGYFKGVETSIFKVKL
jgi:hypothetical protein